MCRGNGSKVQGTNTLLESRTRLGERHRDRFLHEIVQHDRGAEGNNGSDKACSEERAYYISPDLRTLFTTFQNRRSRAGGQKAVFKPEG